ncbi:MULTISPECIES: TIR domain-containing protein [Brevibacillus]|uniref:TIR domain-containing protein n=1 Tax=Brevibacillus brevis (strain 47 / JCM 6285 / NBRC 100599) TaxID=358681 RepID=C0ZIP1_BREBN|nr:TIR domain-containing protein [Brevibacillus brevis]BAH41259.1 hypothetical protein BBR47_02820 [Brevibacillus brevis NBRC 100599]
MVKIFISHATDDATMVTKLMDLLQTQFNLQRENFFYTSDEELKVGGNWIEQIRQGMQDATLIMPIITPRYFESHFCMCELGAAWVNEQALIPIIIPPLKHSALGSTPYRSWAQSITFNSKEDIMRLAESMKDKKVGTFNSVRFNNRAEQFYNEVLSQFVEEMKSREILTPAVLKELRTENHSLIEAYNEAEEEVKKLKAENDALRSLKDAEAVKALDHAKMDEWQSFLDAVTIAKNELDKLPKLVTSVLYHMRKSSYDGFVGDQMDFADLQQLDSKGYIEWDDGWKPVYTHPAVRRADNAIDALQAVIDEDPAIIQDRFEDEYEDVMFGLKYSPFWEEVLGQDIVHSN